MKKYRVNESESFNLHSMLDHLKALQVDMEEGTVPWDDSLQGRIEEVEGLLSVAPFVGSLVDWPTLKRIREIKDERQMLRYSRALASGETESRAAVAFSL